LARLTEDPEMVRAAPVRARDKNAVTAVLDIMVKLVTVTKRSDRAGFMEKSRAIEQYVTAESNCWRLCLSCGETSKREDSHKYRNMRTAGAAVLPLAVISGLAALSMLEK
jgi:hypothetical protein